jgi:hypothetical protein
VKFLLWSIGGFRIYVCGCDEIAAQLARDYAPQGCRRFDWDFFHKLYERDLEIISLPLLQCPSPNEEPRPIGGHADGCRIGFDAGGSDRKVCAVIDEDVSALADAMGMNTGSIMGLAMDTSEAVGYVDQQQNILGWINALAFAPVDLDPNATEDEWSRDRGVGCKYFSQDAVIKLAPKAGISLDSGLSPAEKLKVVQALMEADDPRAADIFETIGVYLACTVVLYAQFYDLRRLMLLGRVMSGKGGEIILSTCRRILQEEFPATADQVQVMLPDENTRRLGQSVAAANLPELRKGKL